MNSNPKSLHRKSIRLKEYAYTFPGWYFVTICTHERNNLFGKIVDGKTILSKNGKVVEEEWIRTKEIRKNVDLDDFVIMPNHLHGIIIIEQSIDGRGELNSPTKNDTGRMQYAPTKYKFISPSKSLGAIVRGFKSAVTKRLRELSVDKELIIWQRNYYEHIIRNDLDLYNIRQYIHNNPLKWELDEYYNA